MFVVKNYMVFIWNKYMYFDEKDDALKLLRYARSVPNTRKLF